jgi:F-type H+-transporting ATPase subunit epsilon
MLLDIVTPDRRVFRGETTDVIVPGVAGELEVLPGHAPFITVLATGILSFKRGPETVRLMVSGGFMEVDGDHVSIIADSAALADEVSPEVERKQLHAVEQQLKALGPVGPDDEGFQRLKGDVDRAAAKLSLIK